MPFGDKLYTLRGSNQSGAESEATTESEHEMEGGLLLNVVVRESSAVLELLTGEDKSLLIRGDALLVLDLGLDILNSVRGLNVQGDGLAGEGLHEDLHATTESEDQVEGGLLLDVVVRKSATILELLASKDESLLIGRNTFLVLDLSLDVFDGVRRLNIESDGLAGESLNEDLHATAKSQDQMESGLFLDVVVAKGSSVLELLTSKDEALLIGGDALLVLDLGLDVLNGVRRLNIEGDGLASQSLDEDLHATAKSEDQVKSGLLLDVVVRKSAAILELLAGEDESLLIGRDALLVLDLSLDVLDGVRGLNVQSNGLACKGLDEDLHLVVELLFINYNLTNSVAFYTSPN
jgi:hypothetical protein